MKINSKKILVVKICCIGDIVQSIPFLRTIKINDPASTISFVATTWCSQLVEMIPEVDKIIIFDAPYEKNLFKKIYQSLLFAIKLFFARYDIAFNLHRTNVWNLFFYFTLIKKRIGFGKSFFLTDETEFKLDAHDSKRYLALLDCMNYNSIEELPYIKTEKVLPEVRNTFSSFGLKNTDKIITIYPDGGVNPGMDMQIKQLSLEKYLSIIDILSKTYSDAKFVIMRSLEDISKSDAIYEKIDKNRCVYLSNLSLQQLAGWFSLSSVVIGGDTGLIHMAAATGTPVVMFFGPTSSEQLAPLDTKHKILNHKIECSPCLTPVTVKNKNNFAGKMFGCKRQDVLCMHLVTAEEVAEAVGNIFQEQKLSN